MEMEKLKKTAVVIDTILKVMFIIVIVGMVLLLVADIAILAIGPMNLENGELSYRIGGANGISFIIADIGNDIDVTGFNGYQLVKGVLLASVSGIVGMAVVLVGIKMLREIIAPMKEGGPFVEGISIKMRNFGIFTLVAGVVGNIIELTMWHIAQRILLSAVTAPEIYAQDLRMNYEYVIDGNYIVFALFIFLLSYIFKYGEELQKQSDETF